MRTASLAFVLLTMSATALAQDAVQARMTVWSKALGVPCTHCHVDGAWTDPAKPNYEFAQRMRPAYAMVAKMLPIFDEIPKHFDQARMPQTQCFMCHQGSRTPERAPRD